MLGARRLRAIVPAPNELLAIIPGTWRRRVTLRHARRWLRAVLFARRHNRGLPPSAPTAAFYPMRLEPTAAVAHVLARLGMRITDFGAPAGLTFAWHTGTYLEPSAAARLREGAINRGCVDISKSRVDRAWADVAGYSIAVDPLTYRGQIVVKPDENGVRGGRIVAGPLTGTRRGRVYQRLIDSRADGRIHTLRPMVFDGRLLVVYTKARPEPNWFAGREDVAVVPPDRVLAADEQALLLRFCAAIALDYGELDVLRDKDSGRIFVVDANRTPIRPRGLAPTDDDAAFGPLEAALAARVRGEAG
jgi:hypothetical protein